MPKTVHSTCNFVHREHCCCSLLVYRGILKSLTFHLLPARRWIFIQPLHHHSVTARWDIYDLQNKKDLFSHSVTLHWLTADGALYTHFFLCESHLETAEKGEMHHFTPLSSPFSLLNTHLSIFSAFLISFKRDRVIKRHRSTSTGQGDAFSECSMPVLLPTPTPSWPLALSYLLHGNTDEDQPRDTPAHPHVNSAKWA